MPYIKEVLIDVITGVSVKESSSTTDHALEDGEQITDHVKSDPTTISLSGVILDNMDEKVLKLRKYRESGEVISYNYMSPLSNMIITGFSRDYSKDIKDGYAFTMSLKQIKMAKVAKFVVLSSTVKKQTKAVSNKGRQQTKKTQNAVSVAKKKKYTKSSKRKVTSTGAVMTQ